MGIGKDMKIPYARQWISESDIAEVVRVLRSDWITQGPTIDKFEKAVADYCGAGYAVALSSGTAALHAVCFAAGITKGDEVIIPALTFVASSNCVLYQQGRPVFCDIQTGTHNIDPDKIERHISKRTKGIITVDFAGHPCDYDEIFKLAGRYNLWVIEDACHSLGASYKKKRIGSFSDMTVFSFHPAKAITTGEGGMVLTNNKALYERLKLFRNHGITKDRDAFLRKADGAWYYEMQELGYNYRITDIQCGLGIAQMRSLDRFINLRREIVQRYNKAFGEMADIIQLPLEKRCAISAWHLYVVRLKDKSLVDNKRGIFDYLRKKGIGANLHYIPVPMHPYYRRRFNYRAEQYPEAGRYYKEAVTLPLFPRMKGKEVNQVIKVFKQAIQRFKK